MSKIFIAVDTDSVGYRDAVIFKSMPFECFDDAGIGDIESQYWDAKHGSVLHYDVDLEDGLIDTLLGISKDDLPKPGQCLEWDVEKGEGILWQGVWK